MLKMQIAFPQLEDEFFNVLSERIVANNFTDERLKDAIGNLIDSFRYPKPSISDVIGFDKRIKIYSYSDYCNEVSQRKSQDEDFERHYINCRLFFVKSADCERYNFKPNTLKIR